MGRTTSYRTLDTKVIGRHVREMRAEIGWTQQELGMETNKIWLAENLRERMIPMQWFSSLEMGRGTRVDITRLSYVARALGVPVSRLMPLPSADLKTSSADIVLSLRSYGLDQRGIDAVMEYIEFWRQKSLKTPPNSSTNGDSP